VSVTAPGIVEVASAQPITTTFRSAAVCGIVKAAEAVEAGLAGCAEFAWMKLMPAPVKYV
jgi:hypothetical protein